MCGPKEMTFLIQDHLLELGIDKKQIHFELFNTGNIIKKMRPVTTKIDAKNVSVVNIHEGGKVFKLTIPKGSDNILDAALKNNADLPYACKGGVCATCRAKLLDGKVDIGFTYGLEQEEIDAGYILTCQAIPMSDKVAVDYDG